MNRVELVGTLVRDPEMKTFQYSMLLTFSIAVNGAAWNRDTRQQEVTTTFVSVEHWLDSIPNDDQIPLKGSEVHVVGELTQYQKEGETRSHTRVRSKVLTITRQGRQARQAAAPPEQQWNQDMSNEEPPF